MKKLGGIISLVFLSVFLSFQPFVAVAISPSSFIKPAYCGKNCLLTTNADVAMEGENGSTDGGWYDLGDEYSYDLNNRGDVNGDGKTDLVMAAPGYGADDKGKIYIYYGPLTSNTTTKPDAVILGEADDDRAGTAIAVGDTNQDGYDDVMIGAPFHDYNGTFLNGAVYIVYGPIDGEHHLSSADVVLYGENGAVVDDGTAGDMFGLAVKSADFNKDGYLDLVASAPRHQQGVVYIFYGPIINTQSVIEADETISETRIGENFNEVWNNFGITLTVGDANGDTIPDVGATEYYSDADGLFFGSSVLFNGPFSGKKTTIDADSMFMAGEHNDGTYFSTSILEIINDINGDGINDVAVGEDQDDRHSPYVFSDYGKTYIFYGPLPNAVSDKEANVIITGEQFQSGFGDAIEGAGDLNQDGYNDLLVSATYLDTNAGENVGGVYVIHGPLKPGFYGARFLSSKIIMGTVDHNGIGKRLASMTDLNNDQHIDIVTSTPWYPYFGDDISKGAAYLFFTDNSW